MAEVLITGANRGIGLALAQHYAGAGHRVTATVRDAGAAPSALREAADRIEELDVTDAGAPDALAGAVAGSGVDILVNNAGVGDQAKLEELDADDFRHVLNVNTVAPLMMLKAFAPLLERSGGLCANITSRLGSLADTTSPGFLAYRASKAGLNIALKAAALDLAPRGVTVLALHPGWVATDMGGKGAPVTPAQSAEGLAAVIEGRRGKPGPLAFFDFRGAEIPW